MGLIYLSQVGYTDAALTITYKEKLKILTGLIV